MRALHRRGRRRAGGGCVGTNPPCVPLDLIIRKEFTQSGGSSANCLIADGISPISNLDLECRLVLHVSQSVHFECGVGRVLTVPVLQHKTRKAPLGLLNA